MKIDLHAHSNYSDGVLPPAELVQMAVAQGVDIMALTDHDCVSGIEAAVACAGTHGITVIPGVEVSSVWRGQTIHVLGLGIDTDNSALNKGIDVLRQQRKIRAENMDKKLAGIGIAGAIQSMGKEISVTNLTRTHFARFLVERGVAKDMRTAFNRYLKKGKPGYVATAWVDLSMAVKWIALSGGVAVVAHPGRYRMTATKMREFLQAFKIMGGEGIEVVTGRSDRKEVGCFAKLAEDFDLYASQGSDFHESTTHGVKLGMLLDMPSWVTPVWRHPKLKKYLTIRERL